MLMAAELGLGSCWINHRYIQGQEVIEEPELLDPFFRDSPLHK